MTNIKIPELIITSEIKPNKLQIQYKINWVEPIQLAAFNAPPWQNDLIKRNPASTEIHVDLFEDTFERLYSILIEIITLTKKIEPINEKIMESAKEVRIAYEHSYEEKVSEVNVQVLNSMIEYSKFMRQNVMHSLVNSYIYDWVMLCKGESPQIIPILKIKSDINSIVWQWTKFKETNQSDHQGIENLWSKNIALGLTPIKTSKSNNEATEVYLAVATRMLTKWYNSESHKSDEIINNIDLFLKGFDPWNLLSSNHDQDNFGKLFDPKYTEIASTEDIAKYINNKERASVIFYHGENITDNFADLSLKLNLRAKTTPKAISDVLFDLAPLGGGNRTHVLGACQCIQLNSNFNVENEGKIKNILTEFEKVINNFPTLDYAVNGISSIGTPLKISSKISLKFIEEFLKNACTKALPLSELLRLTIDKLSQIPQELNYGIISFLLHGDPETFMPFVNPQPIQMIYAKQDSLLIEPLIKELKNNYALPVISDGETEIHNLDKRLFKELQFEEIGEEKNYPLIFPISLSTLGAVLTHPKFGRDSTRKLIILSPAFITNGSNKFIDSTLNSDNENLSNEIRQKIDNYDYSFACFGANSSSGTLIRILLNDLGINSNFYNDKRFFHELEFIPRVNNISSTTMGSIFWSTDFSKDNEKFNSHHFENTVDYLKKNQYINLDKWFANKYLSLIPTIITSGFPMMFFVAVIKDEDIHKYLFTFKEFLKIFRKVHPHDFIHEDFKNEFYPYEPRYFETISNDHIRAMAKFIAVASKLGLWINLNGDKNWKRRRIEAIEKKVEILIKQCLLITPEKKDKALNFLERNIKDFNQERTEEVMFELGTSDICTLHKGKKAILKSTTNRRITTIEFTNAQLDIIKTFCDTNLFIIPDKAKELDDALDIIPSISVHNIADSDIDTCVELLELIKKTASHPDKQEDEEYKKIMIALQSKVIALAKNFQKQTREEEIMQENT